MRKPHKKTPQISNLVEALVATGSNREIIADLVGVSKGTLEKYYADELEHGESRVMSRIKLSALRMALDGDKTMICFVLKTRGGWRETSRTELTGAEGAPLNVALYPVLNLSALSTEELEQYVALEAKCQPAALPADTSVAINATVSE